jgi:hypothetical protein
MNAPLRRGPDRRVPPAISGSSEPASCRETRIQQSGWPPLLRSVGLIRLDRVGQKNAGAEQPKARGCNLKHRTRPYVGPSLMTQYRGSGFRTISSFPKNDFIRPNHAAKLGRLVAQRRRGRERPLDQGQFRFDEYGDQTVLFGKCPKPKVQRTMRPECAYPTAPGSKSQVREVVGRVPHHLPAFLRFRTIWHDVRFSPREFQPGAFMAEVIRFVPKSELERARLIREARAIYDSIFPPADRVVREQQGSGDKQ